MSKQIFLQSESLGDVTIVAIEETAGVAELRAACLAKLPKGAIHAEYLLFVEDVDDEDPFQGFKEIPHGLRVHLHRHKGIDVTVRYAGKDVKRVFRPSTTVGRVKQWSTKDLGIKPSDAAELMLQVAGTSNRPDPDTHIGSLVHHPAHVLVFDLVPSPRVNG